MTWLCRTSLCGLQHISHENDEGVHFVDGCRGGRWYDTPHMIYTSSTLRCKQRRFSLPDLIILLTPQHFNRQFKMPYDYDDFSWKCDDLDEARLHEQWNKYTRQLSEEATSATISTGLSPFTAGVSLAGIAFSAPRVHNARRKRALSKSTYKSWTLNIKHEIAMYLKQWLWLVVICDCTFGLASGADVAVTAGFEFLAMSVSDAMAVAGSGAQVVAGNVIAALPVKCLGAAASELKEKINHRKIEEKIKRKESKHRWQ